MVDLHARGPEALIRREMSPVSAHALINREIHTMRGLAQNREQQEYLPVIDWMYERRKRISTDAMVVNHRNYTLSNVIVGPSGAMSVVDWGWQIGDARFDLAWTLLDLERAGMSDLRDDVLAEYERVTGALVADLAYFEVVGSALSEDAVHEAGAPGPRRSGTAAEASASCATPPRNHGERASTADAEVFCLRMLLLLL